LENDFRKLHWNTPLEKTPLENAVGKWTWKTVLKNRNGKQYWKPALESNIVK
jgi:hypothetical protein